MRVEKISYFVFPCAPHPGLWGDSSGFYPVYTGRWNTPNISTLYTVGDSDPNTTRTN